MPYAAAVKLAGSADILAQGQGDTTVSNWKKRGVPAHIIMPLALNFVRRLLAHPRVVEETGLAMERFLGSQRDVDFTARVVPVLQPSLDARTFDAQGLPMPHEYEVIAQALTRVYNERETDVKAEVVWRMVTALVSIWNGVVPERRPARRGGREKAGEEQR